MARRTKEEALETRHSILDAAERVFLARGVSRTSLNEIAQAAGVTRGAIYWHFQDKVAVFNAMMDRVTLPMEEAALCSENTHPKRALSHVLSSLDAVLDKVVNDPQVRRVFEIALHKVEFVDDLMAVRERHVRGSGSFRELVKNAISAEISEKRLPTHIDADVAARGLLAQFDGLLHGWLLEPNFDLVHVGQTATRTYLAGLAHTPPPV